MRGGREMVGRSRTGSAAARADVKVWRFMLVGLQLSLLREVGKATCEVHFQGHLVEFAC